MEYWTTVLRIWSRIMLTELCLNIDDTIFSSLNTGKENFAKDMLFSYALTLYRRNKLSLGKAAELAGLNRLDFIQRLTVEGEPIFDYDLEIIEDMIAGAQYTINLIKDS
jgi:predicted HTH domain antitoxin